jgi:hypothetical protein
MRFAAGFNPLHPVVSGMNAETNSTSSESGTKLCASTSTTTGEPCEREAGSCPWHDPETGERTDVEAGRPSKMTAQRKQDLYDAAGVGMPLENAAGLAGITYETLRTWMRRGERDREDGGGTAYAEFVREFKRSRARGEKELLEDAGPEFILERSYGYVKTERREIDARVSSGDESDDAGYEIVDAEGEQVHPDRSPEARRKRNEKAQREKQAESDAENAPIAVESRPVDPGDEPDSEDAGSAGEPNDGSDDADRANNAKPTPAERERERRDQSAEAAQPKPLTGRVPDGYESDDG